MQSKLQTKLSRKKFAQRPLLAIPNQIKTLLQCSSAIGGVVTAIGVTILVSRGITDGRIARINSVEAGYTFSSLTVVVVGLLSLLWVIFVVPALIGRLADPTSRTTWKVQHNRNASQSLLLIAAYVLWVGAWQILNRFSTNSRLNVFGTWIKDLVEPILGTTFLPMLVRCAYALGWIYLFSILSFFFFDALWHMWHTSAAKKFSDATYRRAKLMIVLLVVAACCGQELPDSVSSPYIVGQALVAWVFGGVLTIVLILARWLGKRFPGPKKTASAEIAWRAMSGFLAIVPVLTIHSLAPNLLDPPKAVILFTTIIVASAWIAYPWQHPLRSGQSLLVLAGCFCVSGIVLAPTLSSAALRLLGIGNITATHFSMLAEDYEALRPPNSDLPVTYVANGKYVQLTGLRLIHDIGAEVVFEYPSVNERKEKRPLIWPVPRERVRFALEGAQRW